MPYKSAAQRGMFHAMAARGEMSPAVVGEWDKASRGMKLPRHVRHMDIGGAVPRPIDAMSTGGTMAGEETQTDPGDTMPLCPHCNPAPYTGGASGAGTDGWDEQFKKAGGTDSVEGALQKRMSEHLNKRRM